MTPQVEALCKMSKRELDELFHHCTPGRIPVGAMNGTAIIAPGTRITGALAQAIKIFAWQGKVFYGNLLTNRIVGMEVVIADVFLGLSRFDQEPCIVLDYSKRSLVAMWVRDEIRELAAGRYLGKAYKGQRALVHFVLEVPNAATD